MILHYEFECRKWAVKQVREKGASLLASLHLAIRDPELKEIHFTSPIALGQRVRAPPPWTGESPLKAPRRQGQKQAKGAKPAKGKGRGKGGPPWVGNTPDGRQICFSYNNVEGCKDQGCARLHVCRVKGCFGDHPAHKCPKK